MTSKRPAKPRPPARLGPAGRALWGRLHGTYKFDPGEVPLVGAACGVADTIAGLEAVLEADGLTAPGASGQVRIHPAVPELRAQRLALTRLLGSLRLPGEDERPMTAAQEQARSAALARWDMPGARTRDRGAAS